jgi:hypothetical protein
MVETSENLHEQFLYKVNTKIINACMESSK